VKLRIDINPPGGENHSGKAALFWPNLYPEMNGSSSSTYHGEAAEGQGQFRRTILLKVLLNSG
jgi:hypothetical protein